MLLRLLPQPTLNNPAPLTILFTLPLPNHPYTSRSLPLPPALLAHRSLCLQEDIDCPNVLMGEKSSWICGIIDDVTFSLPSSSITVNFIDGSNTTLPISAGCVTELHRVVEEVQLSFTAPTTVPSSPRTSTSSIASTSSASSSSSRTPSSSGSSRRTPSSLLLSLLSPLLSSSSTQPSVPERPSLAAPPCAPARVHRRAARSLLVDTYRRYVLSELKKQLPTSYFPWAIASETSRQMEEFAQVQAEINRIIDTCGVPRDALIDKIVTFSSRSRSTSSFSSGSLSEDESDSDSAPSPTTPATSVFSTSACPTPARRVVSPSPSAFLLSIPPAHALPTQCRMPYASQLARLTQIASRVSQVKKLNVRYEREEGKRRWLEGLEKGRLADKALRRAFSNGDHQFSPFLADVIRPTRLWRSYTMEDLEWEERNNHTHPAMMDISDSEDMIEYAEEQQDQGPSDVDSDEEGPITPPKSRRNSSIDRPLLGIATSITSKVEEVNDVWEEDEDDEDDDEIISTPISLSPPNIARNFSMKVLPTKKPLIDDTVGMEDDALIEECEKWRIYA
ncbi:uncharacterized protein IL334_007680 [Kwoniella shivajii]|uniref:Uncharacterized protein n=1 Tax=Kwoniella shivajii TaxID=564305 RepID=A0ABZ1DAR6_9TREE|nr:hypothetical protein IL334_007680 [Kwoniella shivajii]